MMHSSNKRGLLGRQGEDIAVNYLVSRGWEILDRNWRCASGEVDIVAIDPCDEALVFCEVKCRSGLGYGDPLEAITAAKQAKLRQLAQAWLAMSEDNPTRVRIDAIGVLSQRGQHPVIRHIRGIS